MTAPDETRATVEAYEAAVASGLHHPHVDRLGAGARAAAIQAGHSVLCAELGADATCPGPLRGLPMLEATEPPSCLAGGETTRGDVAPMGPGFKPSEVLLLASPLTATMDRSEAEHAAACIVRVCQARGDRWQSVPWADVKDVLLADLDAGREPFASLVRNPFFRPQADALVLYGFGAWLGERRAVELTPKGLEALRRWVRPATPEAP